MLIAILMAVSIVGVVITTPIFLILLLNAIFSSHPSDVEFQAMFVALAFDAIFLIIALSTFFYKVFE